MGIWRLYLDRGGGLIIGQEYRELSSRQGPLLYRPHREGMAGGLRICQSNHGGGHGGALPEWSFLIIVQRFRWFSSTQTVHWWWRVKKKKKVLTNPEQREDSVLIASWAGSRRLLAGVAPPPERLYICFPGASSSTLFQLPPHFYTTLLHSTIPILLFNHHTPRHSTHNVWHQGW